ncbi:hypothetical protein ACXM2N_05390 [Corynebacterium sp. ZY180755]
MTENDHVLSHGDRRSASRSDVMVLRAQRLAINSSDDLEKFASEIGRVSAVLREPTGSAGGVIALAVGVGIIGGAVKHIKELWEVEQMGESVALIAAETERDLIEALVDLDEVIRTRGVGTAYEQKTVRKPSVLKASEKAS